MVDTPWNVEAIQGHAGGRDKDAAALLRIETTSDTVERIRILVAATPTLLSTLRGCADALREAGKGFATHAGPHAARPNLFELHEAEARKAISLATGERVAEMVTPNRWGPILHELSTPGFVYVEYPGELDGYLAWRNDERGTSAFHGYEGLWQVDPEASPVCLEEADAMAQQLASLE